LRQLLETGKYVACTVHSALRDRDGAIGWLEKALEEKSMHLCFLPIDPRFRWPHKDSAFTAVLKCLGLGPVTPV
jgi:hypothetical protein